MNTIRVGRPSAGRRFLPFLALLAFSFFAACLVDIRPEEIRDRVAPADPGRGRMLLLEALDAQSYAGDGYSLWRAQTGVTVRMTDEWYGLLGRIARPWPNQSQPIRISFMPGSDDGVVEQLTPEGEPTGVVWGIHDWNVWKRVDGELTYEQDPEIHFTLPTVEYFLEAPFRLPDPPALIDYAGTRAVAGKTYDLVYVTWNRVGPQDMVDQYLAYIDRDSGRLERIDCTVRDATPFMTIAVFYKEFRRVGAFELPHRVEIMELKEKPEEFYHVYKIDEWRLDVGLERSAYAPENRPPRAKY